MTTTPSANFGRNCTAGMSSAASWRFTSKYVTAATGGRKLIDVPGYTFRIFVTSSDAAPEEIWRDYNRRADMENRIAELKHDLGADGFCRSNSSPPRRPFAPSCCCSTFWPSCGVRCCVPRWLTRSSRSHSLTAKDNRYWKPSKRHCPDARPSFRD